MLLTDHPLVDTIWGMQDGQRIELAAMLDDIGQADYLLLGEKHDNPVHHQKQSLMVRHLRERERKGQLILEMAELRHTEILSATTLQTLNGLGSALDWHDRGWPDWALYQPITEEALKAGMTLKAGNPDRAIMMKIGRSQPVDDGVFENLRWDRDYSKTQRDKLLDELVKAHCNMMGRDAMGPLVQMQRLKDATMARALREDWGVGDVSVLIAGNGHVRKDRGVPMFLDQNRRTVAVALIEVVRNEFDQTRYPDFDPTQYDYVWFTPRLDEIDPCERFRSQLEGMKSKMEKHGQ